MTVKAYVRVVPPDGRAGEFCLALGEEVWRWLKATVTSPRHAGFVASALLRELLQPVIWGHDHVQFRIPDDIGDEDPALVAHWIERFQSSEPDTLSSLCELYGGRVIESIELVRDLYGDPVARESDDEPTLDQVACGRCECDVCRLLRARLPPSIDLPRTVRGDAATAGRLMREAADLAKLTRTAIDELETFRDADWRRDPAGPHALAVLRDALLECGVTVSTLDLVGLVKQCASSSR